MSYNEGSAGGPPMYDTPAKDSKGDHGQGGTKQDDFLILGRRFLSGLPAQVGTIAFLV